MKKKYLCISFFLLALIFTANTVYALPFINPPEINAPGWQTQFPYQRNIYWDFSVAPQGGPSPNGTPGAHYEGYADPCLKCSDFVSLIGDVVWNPHLGAIGVEGYGGIGGAIFHLDNFLEPQPVKHIYLEATIINSNLDFPTAGWGPPRISVPSGYEENKSYWGHCWTPAGGDRWLLNMWFEVLPNPPWEDIILPFSLDLGSCEYVWIDDLHIATECIPEPATMILLGSLAAGLFGTAGFRKKK